MLMPAVDTYMAVRRAAGYKLRDVERYLREFAHFATTRGDSHVVAQTAITWAARSPSKRSAPSDSASWSGLPASPMPRIPATRFRQSGNSAAGTADASRTSSRPRRSGPWSPRRPTSGRWAPCDPTSIARYLGCSQRRDCGFPRPWHCGSKTSPQTVW